jgi:hypothetical protein
MRKSALLGDHPQRITRGFKRPDDQTGAETNCQVVFETGDGIGNGVVNATHVEYTKINIMVEDNIHSRDKETIIRGNGAQRIENVDSVGVV